MFSSRVEHYSYILHFLKNDPNLNEMDMKDCIKMLYNMYKPQSIGIGDHHTVILKSDRTLISRGKNNYD